MKAVTQLKLLFWRGLLLALFSHSTLALAEEPECMCSDIPAWGASAIYRTADVLYTDDSGNDTVSSFIPMLYYDGEHLFLDGLGGGVYVYKAENERWDASLFSRIRFIDTPEQYQNALGGAATDFGLRLKYRFLHSTYSSVEALSDSNGAMHATFNVNGKFNINRLNASPFITMRYKTSQFNAHYYGLNDWDFLTQKDAASDIGSGVDVKLGVDLSYKVGSNFYLHAGISGLFLEDEVTDLSHVTKPIQSEYYLGFGFLSDDESAPTQTLTSPAYLRLSHGWGTPSNLGSLTTFEIDTDPYNSQLTTLFYGHPVSDQLFGLPVSVYVTPGFGWHWSHEAQQNSQEYIVAIKAFYTFTWPIRWRLGLAEGLSYTSKVNYLENTDFENKGYDNPSQLLNYLDFSIDVNIGDLTGVNDLQSLWLGYSVHHRSAIFELSSQYGRMKGGSNYNMISLTYDI